MTFPMTLIALERATWTEIQENRLTVETAERCGPGLSSWLTAIRSVAWRSRKP